MDTGRPRTYRGDVTSPGDRYPPDEGDRAQPNPNQQYAAGLYGRTPDDDAAGGRAEPPYVYNPYGNVSYPATYPVPPAGLGPGDDRTPMRRPGVLHVALALLLVSAVPYLLGGLLAVLGAGSVEAAVPPEQQAQMQQLGVDLEQVVRTAGALLLAVSLAFVLLAVLAWTGRRWARALLAALTVGIMLMVLVILLAGTSQGVPLDGAGLLMLAGPAVLALVGVVLMFGAAAREWFARSRR